MAEVVSGFVITYKIVQLCTSELTDHGYNASENLLLGGKRRKQTVLTNQKNQNISNCLSCAVSFRLIFPREQCYQPEEVC